jgi:hypothetical protein
MHDHSLLQFLYSPTYHIYLNTRNFRLFYLHKRIDLNNNNNYYYKLPLCLINQALRHEDVWGSGCIDQLTVTCRVVRVTKITGSSSDDWIYYTLVTSSLNHT